MGEVLAVPPLGFARGRFEPCWAWRGGFLSGAGPQEMWVQGFRASGFKGSGFRGLGFRVHGLGDEGLGLRGLGRRPQYGF